MESSADLYNYQRFKQITVKLTVKYSKLVWRVYACLSCYPGIAMLHPNSIPANNCIWLWQCYSVFGQNNSKTG